VRELVQAVVRRDLVGFGEGGEIEHVVDEELGSATGAWMAAFCPAGPVPITARSNYFIALCTPDLVG
jgi:hypothetical protein